MALAYIGRFAPSPTGPAACRLAGRGAGQLARCARATAAAGWCASRTWTRRAACPARPRRSCEQLAACGLLPDEAPVWQSRRGALYQAALDQLVARRPGLPLRLLAQGHRAGAGSAGPSAQRGTASWSTPAPAATGLARAAGARLALQAQRRRRRCDWHGPPPGPAAAGRGARGRRLRAQARRRPVGLPARRGGRRCGRRASRTSCAAKTWPTTRRGRSCCSTRCGLPTPRYLHTPLVLGANGEKLSKQNGAQPLDTSRAAAGAQRRGAGARPAAQQRATVAEALAAWQAQWRDSYNLPGD